MKFKQGLVYFVLFLVPINGKEFEDTPGNHGDDNSGTRLTRSSQCRRTLDFDWSDKNCFIGPVSIRKDISPQVFHQLCPRARGKAEAPSSCDLYITCHDSSLTVNRCPPGNHFHPIDKTCVDSHLFECSHPVLKDPSVLLKERGSDHSDKKRKASLDWEYGNSGVIRVEDSKSGWCQDEEGIFPHPESCEYFIQCGSAGRVFEKKCPPGTAFNSRISVCDHKYNVDCPIYTRRKRSNLPNSEEFTPITTIAMPDKEPEKMLGHEIEKRSVSCGREFITPDPQFCNKFQVCSNGRIHTQECGKGTVFDPLKKVCTRPVGIDCGSRMRDFDTYDCQKGFKYSTTHPDDCHKFIECENEQIHIKSCPSKTVYNPEKGMCDFTYKTACKSIISLEHDLDINYLPMTRRNRRQDLSKYECEYNYIAPLDGSCLSFIECENKRLFKKNCGPGTAYNPLLGQCDWPFNVRSPDPEYCQRYLQCDGRKFVPKQCPNNHYYNQENGKCQPIEQVNCSGKRDDPRQQQGKHDEYLQSK